MRPVPAAGSLVLFVLLSPIMIAGILLLNSTKILEIDAKGATEKMQENGKAMQKIESIISELKTIMQSGGITQTKIISLLDGRCSRNTVITFLNKDEADPKLSTLLMILDACGVELRLDTERSREAMISGDIAAYRTEAEALRSEVDATKKDLDFFKGRYEELIDKNTALTKTVEKQQAQIEKYMQRMENADNALYAAQDDVRRKDARIVELSKKLKMW